MTSVMREAEAPRAASSIRRASTRCSCTGVHQRLDDEHVPLAAIGLELDLQAVIGEAHELGGVQRHAEVPANLGREFGMGAPA